MNVRLPKPYNLLSKRQQEDVCNYLAERAAEDAKERYDRSVEQLLMIACIALHRNSKTRFGALRCKMFLASFRKVFHDYAVNDDKDIHEEIGHIFRKYGWPHGYITEILREKRR